MVDYNRKAHVFRFNSRRETEENIQAILERLPFVLLGKEEDNEKTVKEKAEELHQYILYKRTHSEDENQQEPDEVLENTAQPAYE